MWWGAGGRRREMILEMSQRNGPGRRMVAGSLKRLNRNGSTAAGPSGPPRLNSTTASRSRLAISAPPATYHLDAFAHMFRRRFPQDAVPQIANQGPPAHGLEATPASPPHRPSA